MTASLQSIPMPDGSPFFLSFKSGPDDPLPSDVWGALQFMVDRGFNNATLSPYEGLYLTMDRFELYFLLGSSKPLAGAEESLVIFDDGKVKHDDHSLNSCLVDYALLSLAPVQLNEEIVRRIAGLLDVFDNGRGEKSVEFNHYSDSPNDLTVVVRGRWDSLKDLDLLKNPQEVLRLAAEGLCD